MCSPETLLFAALVLSGIAVLCYAEASFSRFQDRLRSEHVAEWSRIKNRRVIFADGDPVYVSTQYYFLARSYVDLDDMELRRIANTTWRWYLSVWIIVAAWIVLALEAPEAGVFQCFVKVLA
jgi:hypothetical protein